MKKLYKILLLSISLCLGSCLDDLDFEQVDDFELEPTVVVSLLNIGLNSNDLIQGDIFEEPFEEETLLPSLQNTLIQEDLEILTLEFEFNNSFENDFTVEVFFLDEFGEFTYVVQPITVSSTIDSEADVFSYKEDIVILNSPNFLNSDKISVRINYTGETINDEIDASFVFKSAALFYF